MTTYTRISHSPARFIPYILIVVSFLGWELIKRTPVFISTTLSQQALRIHGVISGSMLLLLTGILFVRFCLSGSRFFQLYRFEKYLILMLFVDLVAFIVGSIHRNATVFLIGDTYKFSVIPLAYFCTMQAIRREDAGKLFLFMVVVETAVTLETFGAYTIRLASGIYERAPEHAVTFLPFVFFMAALASEKRLSRVKRNLYSLLLVVFGAAALLARARTLWIQMFLCPLVLLLVEKKIAFVRSMIRPIAFALILLIPLLVFVGAVYQNVVASLGERMVETIALVRSVQQIGPGLSNTRRIVEVRSALDALRESSSALNFVVGMGNGAEFYAPTAALDMGSRPGYKHHIHNGYVSLFFRMGAFGLITFLLFAFAVTKSAYGFTKGYAAKDETYSLMSKVIFAYFILTLVEFLTIYSFIGDIRWGVLLGILRVIAPNHREQARQVDS